MSTAVATELAAAATTPSDAAASKTSVGEQKEETEDGQKESVPCVRRVHQKAQAGDSPPISYDVSGKIEGSAASSPGVVPSRKRLYVSNLKWQISEERLRGEFARFGEVTEARVVRDRRSGWSRGFGFVSFYNDESAKNAMDNLNGADIEGRLVRIEFAKSAGPQNRQNHVGYYQMNGSIGTGRVDEMAALDETGGACRRPGAPHPMNMPCMAMDANGYCMQLPPGYAYIPQNPHYVDQHGPYSYMAPYYPAPSIDMVMQQMQMMSFDPTTMPTGPVPEPATSSRQQHQPPPQQQQQQQRQLSPPEQQQAVDEIPSESNVYDETDGDRNLHDGL